MPPPDKPGFTSMPPMTDLGRLLAHDADGHVFGGLMAQLDARLEDLEQRRERGLRPSQSRLAASEAAALHAARQITEIVWRLRHAPPRGGTAPAQTQLRRTRP